jgi:putative ABC transport system permease protein
MERRREIGLRKALGGQDRDVMLEFVIEGGVLGLAGGILGWALGLLVSQGIGQSVFHAPIAVRLPILPLAIVLATALAALAAFIPAKIAARVRPAIVLRGE